MERQLPDGLEGGGHVDGRQLPAPEELVRPDALHRVGDGHGGQVVQYPERPFADGGDAVAYGYLLSLIHI